MGRFRKQTPEFGGVGRAMIEALPADMTLGALRAVVNNMDQEFGGHPVGAAPLPGRAMPVAGPPLARGVSARPPRAFFACEQRGEGFLSLLQPYRGGVACRDVCSLTSLKGATAASTRAAVACGAVA